MSEILSVKQRLIDSLRQAAEQAQQAGPQQLVDTDDLVFMIGVKEVELLNRKKHIDLARRTIQSLQAHAAQARQVRDAAQASTDKANAEAAELKKSNDSLSSKNIELDRELTKARNNAAEQLRLRLEAMQAAEQRIAELTDQVERREKEILRRDRISASRRRKKS